MKYSDIVKFCEENRIPYDKTIKKIDGCSFPNDACYDLSKVILSTLEEALHIGFKTDFHSVAKLIKELTEVAVALTSPRADRNIPLYTKAVKNVKNELSGKAAKIEEDSVMKNTMKQYIDSALGAIKYMSAKHETEEAIQPYLQTSEQIYKEMDSLLNKIFDEKSEEAVQLSWKIYNAVKVWRDAAATGMLNSTAVQSLVVAKDEMRKWTQLYAKQKAAKTNPPIYIEDAISSYANIGKHIKDYELFKMNLNNASKGIEVKLQKVAKLKDEVSEMEQEVNKLTKEKEKLDRKKKELKRDYKNGDISEDEALRKLELIKERLEDIEEEFEDWDDRIAVKKDLIMMSMDKREHLIEQFNSVVEKAEIYKEQEEIFIEISKQMEFQTMIKVLNGTVSDVYKNIDFIIQIARENAAKMYADIRLDGQKAREMRREQESNQNRFGQKNREAEVAKRKALLADLMDDEDEDEEEVKERSTNKAKETRSSIFDDDF